jgi:hypothetical protein
MPLICKGPASVARSTIAYGGRIGVGLLGVAMCCALLAPPAEARLPPRVSPPMTRISVSSLTGRFVCSLTKFTAKAGARKLIAALGAEAEDAVVAATLVSSVAKPLCAKALPKLKPVFQETVREKPAARRAIGPFVFNLYGTESPYNATYSRVTAHWSDFDLTSAAPHPYYLWYSVDGDSWARLPGPSVLIAHGHNVRLAVRIVDVAGYASPFTYSSFYRID